MDRNSAAFTIVQTIRAGVYLPFGKRLYQLRFRIWWAIHRTNIPAPSHSWILSREVFAFLPISGGVAFARSLHIVSAFWGFILMAFHLGLHWNMVLGMARRAFGPVSSGPVRFLLFMAAVFTAGYGGYALIKNQILSYLFLRNHFVFFDYEKPVVLFFAEYTAMMGLFVFLAHYGSKGLQKLAKSRPEQKITDAKT